MTRRTTLGDRSFPVAATGARNALPGLVTATPIYRRIVLCSAEDVSRALLADFLSTTRVPEALCTTLIVSSDDVTVVFARDINLLTYDEDDDILSYIISYHIIS